MVNEEDAPDAALVEQFVAVTETSVDIARTHVTAADGDLQTAIAMYFAAGHGEANPRSSQGAPRRQLVPRESAVPPAAPAELAHPSPPRRRSINPLGYAVRAIGVVFSTAFQAADWVISLLLPGSAYRTWRGLLCRLLGTAGSHSPVSALLTEAYGDRILQFSDGKWQHAYNRAYQQGKPLLVYLHSSNNPATEEFCSEGLCHEELVAFASANLVCWGAPSDSPDATQLTRLLRVQAFPFLAILAPAEASATNSARTPARIQVLVALNGAPEPPMGPQLLALLQAGTEQAQQHQSEAVRRQEAAVAAAESRSLREEQDAALAASMAEDKRRGEEAAAARRKAAAAEEAEAAEQRAQQEEQERKLQMIEDRRNAIDERRELKRAALPAEPATSACSPATTLIRVRLPHGGSSQRRFEEDAAVSVLYDWVDSLADIDVWDYVIASTFPRREFARSEGGVALRDAGLVPNAAIMIIAQDN